MAAQLKNKKKAEKNLYCLKATKIDKMWDKQTAAESGISFTLAFSGNYWHQKSGKMKVRKPYSKKWQNLAQANYDNEWYKFL